MRVEWSPAVISGYDSIDNQHKELFVRVNQFLEACDAGVGIQELNSVADYMARYVVEHFQTEEDLMLRFGYPDMDNHKALHEHFKKEFGEILAAINAGGSRVVPMMKMNALLVGWLMSHVQQADKELVDFLKKQKGAS